MMRSSKIGFRSLAVWPFSLTAFFFFLLHPCVSAQRVYKPEDVPNVQLADSTRLVTDEAGLLSNAQEEVMNGRLRAIRSSHAVEFAVVTLPSIGDAPLEDFTLKLARQWGVGNKKNNNGLLLVLVLDQRRVRFETGYGLEGYLPDGLLSRIIHDRMIPHFRSGNYAEGLSEGVLAVQQVLDGSYDVKPDGGDRSAVSRVSWGTIFIFYCFFMLLASASVLYQLTSYRRQYPRATAVEEYEFLRRRISMLGCVFLLLFPPGFIVVMAIIKSRQNKLKKEMAVCPCCHQHSVHLLDQSLEEDRYLSPSQQMEHKLKSRDFRVYACSSCDHTQIIGYDHPGTSYKRCPNCGTVALRYMGEKRVRTDRGMMIRKEWRCLYCGENHTQECRDNNDAEAAATGILLGSLLGRGGRSGGFGGGFGGGGFGGGSFGGGGASGGW